MSIFPPTSCDAYGGAASCAGANAGDNTPSRARMPGRIRLASRFLAMDFRLVKRGRAWFVCLAVVIISRISIWPLLLYQVELNFGSTGRDCEVEATCDDEGLSPH